MPIYKRPDIEKLLTLIDNGEPSQVYLVVGDRYLCQDVVSQILEHLLPDGKGSSSIKRLDGDLEDPAGTLQHLKSHNLFSGNHVYVVKDSRLLHSQKGSKLLWDRAEKLFSGGETDRSQLVLRQLLAAAELLESDAPAEALSELSASAWKARFGFNKPTDFTWVKEVFQKPAEPDSAGVMPTKPAGIADLYLETYENGKVPARNILILAAENADKKEKFYLFLKKRMTIVDLTVAAGQSKGAQQEQNSVLEDLITGCLADFQKKMAPGVLAVFLDRVGFHPVAVVRETEKLALYTRDRPIITREDLDAVIGRTREEAVYELTEAFADRKLGAALLIMVHMKAAGVHPLVVVSSLRNYLRKLLLIRSLQGRLAPVYSKALPFNSFSGMYLPALKTALPSQAGLLGGHPYALYMLFRKAESYSVAGLQRALRELLMVEMKLKSSGVDGFLLLESLFFDLLLPAATR